MLKSVLEMLWKFLNDPKYVYGAGWYERTVACDPRTFSRTMQGRDQPVVEKVAEG